MFRGIGIILAGSRWKAVLVAAGLSAAAARFASADAGSLTLDDAWFVTLARAESLLAGATAPSDIDSVDRAAVAEQIRLGVYVLGSLVHASISADTLLARPIATVRPSGTLKRGWKNRIFRMTGVISAAAGLLHLAASLGHASPGTRSVLATIGGSAAGLGSVFHRLRADAPSPPALDPIERIRMVGLESDLRDAVEETELAAESLWRELRGMALDSCATGDQTLSLARRWANALPAASAVLDSRVARSAAIARSCAQHPGFDEEARQRFRALHSHLEAMGSGWQERRWLFERSRRNALDYLVLVDRP